MEKAKGTINLDGGEMEMYSIACWAVAYLMVTKNKFEEAKKWLVLWQKMRAAKRDFHAEAERILSEKYLGNEEKPTIS